MVQGFIAQLCQESVCSAWEGTVPAPGATITSQGALRCTRNQHIYLHLVAPAETTGSRSIPPAPSSSCCREEQPLILQEIKTLKPVWDEESCRAAENVTRFIKTNLKFLDLCLFLFCLVFGIEKMGKAEMKSHRKWKFTSILAKASLIPTNKFCFHWYFSHIKIPFILLRNLSFPTGGKSFAV